MAEFVVGVFSEIIKSCGEPLLGLICNFKNLRKNFAQLEKDAKDLYVRRDDTKDVIRIGGERKKPTGVCQSWLEKVGEFEKEMEDMKNKYEANERCLWGWCPSIPWRIKLGEKVVEMMAKVTGLKQELAEFADRVLVDIVPAVMAMPATAIEAATSTDLTIQTIMECIKDEGIGKIGVCGMGGVGKTTIMKSLNNRKDIADMFNIVIWVTVSKDWSVRKVQNEVAERLSLQMGYDASEDTNAQKIFQNLKSRTFLLLLDDVWQMIDLDSIGIPNPDQQKGSKVILTTRSLNVCNQMETNKEIQVNVLTKDESWRLFREKAGEVVDFENIEPIARNVVEECGGLPLAIIVIGASLRKETDVHVWNNALAKLRSPDTSKIEDMEEKVFQRLAYSYERLRDYENVQNCFLYGALYPEDYQIAISELIEHWREEGFIDVVGSLAMARDEGHAILKRLKDASLFESGERVGTVKMHDVIRDLALRITSPRTEGRKFLVRAGLQIEEAPKEEEWKQIERMSLMSNNHELFNLPDRPECSMLTTLFLQLNLGLKTIPESFFNHMSGLRVLDLSRTGIECLPPSICNLVNLVALYLNDCDKLVGLPSQIGEFKRLEVLSLDYLMVRWGPTIKCLPTEIGKLSHLRSLKVALSSEVRNNEGQTIIIARGVLSRLSRLEELSIWFKPSPVDLMCEECVDIVEELCTLKQLNNLRFVFPTIECLERLTNSSSVWNNKLLVAFSFTVGYYRSQVWTIEDTGNAYLEFIGGNSIPSAVVEVLNRSKKFSLVDHSAVGSLSEFGMKNMSGLQGCTVYRCNAMETLIDGESILGEEGALPKLENLSLEYLPSLRSIWEGPVRLGSLGCLKELTLSDCHGVSTILSRDMIEQLSNLEILRVRECSRIKEIVEEVTSVEGVHHLHLLPKLNALYLSDLKKLERICCKGVQLALPLVESITVRHCTELTSVFEGILNLTSLRKLELRNLPKISKIFLREIIQQLSTLECLSVSHCREIEEMFEEEEKGEEYHSLPKLKTLCLSKLPKLVSIGCKREREVPFCYPSLEFIEVRECPNLKRLSLGVENTTTIKNIWGEREWWEALEWEDDAIKHQLQPHFFDPCPGCLTNPNGGMAFGCGHQTCYNCGVSLMLCPICWDPIETRRKLY